MRKIFILLSIISLGFFSSCSEKEDVVTIHTEFGDIILILYNETPEHKKNFIELAKEYVQCEDRCARDRDPPRCGRIGFPQ